MANATVNVQSDQGHEQDDNVEAILKMMYAMQTKYQEASYKIDTLSAQIQNYAPMVGVVKGRANVTSPVSYGPFALEVYVPEMGDDRADTRIAQCERVSSGRIVIPKRGSYVTVYAKHGSPDRLVWRGMGVEGFPSLTSEERSTKFLQLAADPLISDIDIYESNDDFHFILDRTIPALHKLLLELTSPLGRITISTGPGGKIFIGDGGLLVDLEMDVGGSIKMLAGDLPISTIDASAGGDVSISSYLGNILLDSLISFEATTLISKIKMTPASILLKGGPSPIIEPGVLGISLTALLTALITEMSTHVHATLVGPTTPSLTGPNTATVTNALLPFIISKGITMN